MTVTKLFITKKPKMDLDDEKNQFREKLGLEKDTKEVDEPNDNIASTVERRFDFYDSTFIVFNALIQKGTFLTNKID